jgi:hypothetical protein
VVGDIWIMRGLLFVLAGDCSVLSLISLCGAVLIVALLLLFNFAVDLFVSFLV